MCGCAQKPDWYGVNQTNNYVKPLVYTKDFLGAQKDWNDVLKRQPIVSSNRNPQYKDLINTQVLCNTFKWAHYKDELSTPKEAQTKGWGDCKDAAICKYYKLRALGWEANQMNLWSGWYGKKYEKHLTLAIQFNNNQYILDDLTNKVQLANNYMHKDFEPFWRLNENGWSVH